MKILDIPQHIDGIANPEWLAFRVGRVTASRIADIMANGKSGAPAKSRTDYADELVAEILTGQSAASTFTNAAMAWGTNTEPQARQRYELETQQMVIEVGMVLHPTIERGAASPDGMVGTEGMVEFKCPNTSTHLSYLDEGIAPKKYAENQCQWQMACAGPEIQWCDFVSFDPRLPEHLQYLCVRVHRDENRIAHIESEVRLLLAEVEARVANLMEVAQCA